MKVTLQQALKQLKKANRSHYKSFPENHRHNFEQSYNRFVGANERYAAIHQEAVAKSRFRTLVQAKRALAELQEAKREKKEFVESLGGLNTPKKHYALMENEPALKKYRALILKIEEAEDKAELAELAFPKLTKRR